MIDYVLSRMLEVLFTGEAFDALDRDELIELISARLEIQPEIAALILDERPDWIPAVVRCVDGDAGCHLGKLCKTAST